MKPYGPGIPLVVDTSAWVRQREAAFAAALGGDGPSDVSVRLDRD